MYIWYWTVTVVLDGCTDDNCWEVMGNGSVMLYFVGNRKDKGKGDAGTYLGSLEKVWVYPRLPKYGCFSYERNSPVLKRIFEKMGVQGSEDEYEYEYEDGDGDGKARRVEIGLIFQLNPTSHGSQMTEDVETCKMAIRRERRMDYDQDFGFLDDKASDGSLSMNMPEEEFEVEELEGQSLVSMSWSSRVSHIILDSFDAVRDDHGVLCNWTRTLFPRAISLRLARPLREGAGEVAADGPSFEDGDHNGSATMPSSEGDEAVEKQVKELVQTLVKGGCDSLQVVAAGGKTYKLPK
ncbi:hypothetical protein AX17_004872 [Amanita inopinata Kibby_2008]|nr:hypothetical protein AX17_004872 [Amanita inopinata Kibby_2008]